MEPKLTNGDYTLSGGGGFSRAYGSEALLCRILFRLSARRGKFELMPDMGSRLWLLPSKPRSMWQRYAWEAVAEALSAEAVSLTAVTVEERNGRLYVAAELSCDNENLTVEVTVR